MAEKETLAARVTQLESKMDNKDELDLEQYSRRSCLVIICFAEPRAQHEDTDSKVREFCRERLDVELLERAHRLWPKRTDQEGKVILRPIIVKFSTYRGSLCFVSKLCLGHLCVWRDVRVLRAGYNLVRGMHVGSPQLNRKFPHSPFVLAIFC